MSVNTGNWTGVNQRLQHFFDKDVLQIPCRHHCDDLTGKDFFKQDSLDGKSTGNNTGGDLTKIFNKWRDYMHTGNNWAELTSFIKEMAKEVGKAEIYAELDLGNERENYRELLKWLTLKDSIVFKRGDYGKFKNMY